MPTFKPAYLIHGDDHGRIGERRARLRELAERESGASGVEVFEGDAATPEAVADALCAMTFAIGRRFVIVDGVERWKDAEVADLVAPALAAMARRHHRRVLRPRGRPRQGAGQARRRGQEGRRRRRRRDDAEGQGAAALADATRPQARRRARRRRRPGARRPRRRAPAAPAARAREARARARARARGSASQEVDEVAADSAERQVWGFVDALVARDTATATRRFLELRAQGEAMPRLIPSMARRLREVLGDRRAPAGRARAPRRSRRLDRRATRGRSTSASSEARNADPDALRRALVALADLELDTRGGSELSEDTLRRPRRSRR